MEAFDTKTMEYGPRPSKHCSYAGIDIFTDG